MKKEDVKFYILVGVAVLTLLNTILILNIKQAPVLGSASNSTNAPAGGGTQINNVSQDKPITATINNNGNATITPQGTGVTAPEGPLAAIKFEKYEHDFGTVKALTNNKYKFKFTNSGTVPLTIQDARASCGCTVPNWPKQPIMPNQTSEIEVEFTPKENQLGAQDKSITITANTPEKQTILKIKANVVQ